MKHSLSPVTKNNRLVFVTNSAKHYKIKSQVKIDKFPDGEINLSIKEKIKGEKVTIIGATHPPAENLIELLFLIDAARQSGAKQIQVIIPYFGYARSDKQNGQNKFIPLKTIVKILELAGGKNCNFTILDSHNSNKLQKYFKKPFKEINVNKQMADEFSKINDLSIVAPDAGSIKKALEFSSYLKQRKIVKISKKRLSYNKVKILKISGNVTENVLIVDDMISSANTILETARLLKNQGAKNIFVAVTHILYNAKGWQKLASSKLINKIVTTNSINPPQNLPNKFKVLQLDNVLNKLIY